MLMLAWALVGLHAKAAPQAQPKKSTPPVAATQSLVTASTAGTAFQSEGLCSLNVVNWDLSKTLNFLSEQTKTNLILMSDPGAKLTLRVENIPLSQMVRHICALSGVSVLKVGDAYVFASDDKLKAGYQAEWLAAHPPAPPAPPVPVSAGDAIVDQSVVVSNVSASEVSTTISKLIGNPKLVVVVGPAPTSPAVAATDTSAATGTAATIVQKDTNTDGLSRTLMLHGPKQLVDQAVALIAQMDVPRSQVTIGVTVHEVDKNAARNLGLSWNYGNLQVTESQAAAGNLFGVFSRAGLSFTGAISALESKSKAKLIAAPNITVLDGERAYILVGQRLTFPVLTGYSQANTPIFSTQDERVGIYLQVSTRISPDGTVTLSLYPQVSTVSGYIQINGASYPQIATNEAQTILRVKSGETIVLGGLLNDQDLNELDSVPILGNLPLIGELFRNHTKTHTGQEVLITLTPVIQKPSQ